MNSFGLSNFKIFKDDVSLDFSKINILTGKNNSGKSSFISGLKLFNDEIGDIVIQTKKANKFKSYKELKNKFSNNIPISFIIPAQIKDYSFINKIKLNLDSTISGNYGFDITSVELLDNQESLVSTDYLEYVDIIYFLELAKHNIKLSSPSIFHIFHEGKEITRNIIDTLLPIEKRAIEGLSKRNILPNAYRNSNQLVFIPGMSKTINNYIENGILDDERLTPFIKTELEKETGLLGLSVKFTENYKVLSNKYNFDFTEFLKKHLPSISDHLFFLSSVNDRFSKHISKENEAVYHILRMNQLFENLANSYKLYSKQAFYDESRNFLNKYFNLFDLGSAFSIKDIDDRLIKLIIHKRELSFDIDELGTGHQRIIALLLKISEIILLAGYIDEGETVEIDEGLEGIGWIGNFKDVYSNTFLIIEEPESNLHPDFQSKLADLIVEAATKYNVQFLIETHSEYFIRKLQYLVGKKECKPEDIALYYFTNPDNLEKEEKPVRKIEFLPDGGLSDSFGKGFYDEATSLKFDLLRLNRTQNN
jgi:predicted ATP-dependent endonuclease of OLD family